MFKLTAIGNLGKDAVMKHQENGDRVINFSVAVNTAWKDKAGQRHERTSWVDCALWRTQQQSTEILQYLKTGTTVYVEGEPSVRAYINSNGEAAGAQVLKVSMIELVGGKKAEQPTQAPQQPENKPKPGDLPPSSFDNEPEPAAAPTRTAKATAKA
ncbi:hypothetical protein GCM10023185_13340 [Hymenobacter saemangeumensis]|uniref:Single-stranded DNA-binding protein n=1 Tax=Hymenobacter saemangeumensis TaxID=1084522 RepID=A0ABP8I7M1_9BACT